MIFHRSRRFVDSQTNGFYPCMVMSETIEAIYENGVFKPVGEISWPEGVHVRIETPSAVSSIPAVPGNDLSEQIRQRLLADGATSADAKRILDNLELLWTSLDGLTDTEREIVEQARLNQQDFFAATHP